MARSGSSAGSNHAFPAVLRYDWNVSRAADSRVEHTAERALEPNLSPQVPRETAKKWSRGAGAGATSSHPPAARAAPFARLASGREPHSGGAILFDAPRANDTSARNELQLYMFRICQRSGVRVKSGLCVAVRPERVLSEAPYRV